nr:hypothetical protein [Tanacetum cinerariifolium]
MVILLFRDAADGKWTDLAGAEIGFESEMKERCIYEMKWGLKGGGFGVINCGKKGDHVQPSQMQRNLIVFAKKRKRALKRLPSLPLSRTKLPLKIGIKLNIIR